MPNRRTIAICVALSALIHLAGLFLALLVPSKEAPREDVMVVDLADMPRSSDFLPPKPGIVEGAQPRPRPVPAPRPAPAPRPLPVPRSEALAGRVPDRPVDPSLRPEKAFPAEKSRPAPQTPREETPPGASPPKGSAQAPAKETAQPPPAGGLKSLRELTPSLGKMVMARREDGGGGRGNRASSGNAVGTGGKAQEKGEIAEERGTGTHLTALNAPEIQYISYFASIKRKIELVWQYPAEALHGGLQGDLIIEFTIGRSGSLDSLSLIRGSGYRVLDEEAITAIRRAAPYNPIPAAYAIPNLQIRAHFVYEMHDLRLR